MESIKVKAERRKVKAFLYGGAIACFLLCAFNFQPAKAQTFQEWFEQGKTQIEYLIKQIAALNAFESSVRQGYQSLKNDWTAIGNWKNGEYGLHQGYYNSLSQVNPAVVQISNNENITAEQQSIVSQFAEAVNLKGLTGAEQSYVGEVQQSVLSDCGKAMNDLQAVLTPGNLVMTDDERIRRVAGIADEVKNLYLFTCHFVAQLRLLVAERQAESDDSQNLKGLYGND